MRVRGRHGRVLAALLAAVACAAAASTMPAAADDGRDNQQGWSERSRTHREGRKNVTVVYGSAVNYRDGSGRWQPIDDTLVRSSAKGYEYENRADAHTLRFPADLGAAPVQLDLGKATIGFALRGARGAAAVSGSTARYEKALPGVDVSYRVTSRGAHELLTLADASAQQIFTYDLRLADGVTAQQLGPRAVAFVVGGEAVSYFVAPAMYDAAGARSSALTVALRGDTVVVTPDRGWITSAARAWPVTIDPDVLTLIGANQDTYIQSGSPDTYFGGDPLLRVGYDGAQKIRGLLNFQVASNLPSGAAVDDARLALYLEAATTAPATPVSAYSVVARWGSATWNQFDWDYQLRQPRLWSVPGGDVDASAVATATPAVGTSTTWDVTQLVQRQVSGLVAPNGFLLKQDTEATAQVYGFTSTWSYGGHPIPTLTVTWHSASAAGPAASLVGGNSVDFGSAPVGTAAPTQQIGVQNAGGAPLTVRSLTIAGPQAGDFGVASTTCTSAPVQPGSTCWITLSAVPGGAGNRSGTLAIASDAPNSPHNVALAVTGLAPASATVSPAGLSFGSVRIGSTGATQWVTVRNGGSTDLSITGVSRVGAQAADFLVPSDGCSGKRLASGQSCTVGVRARPRARGSRSATLWIASNASGGGNSVSLAVTGS